VAFRYSDNGVTSDNSAHYLHRRRGQIGV